MSPQQIPSTNERHPAGRVADAPRDISAGESALSGSTSEEFLATRQTPTHEVGEKIEEWVTVEGGIDALNEPTKFERVNRGRPRVLNEFHKATVCQLLSTGLSRRQAAIALNIVHSTIANEMERDADFAERVARAEELSVIKPLQAIAKASETNWRAATWLLGRNGYRLRRAKEQQKEKE